jgi:DNA-binding CsgD family transcriptional regulator
MTPQWHARTSVQRGWSGAQLSGPTPSTALRVTLWRGRRRTVRPRYGNSPVGTGGDRSCPLSARELEVLRLMALEGLQTPGIAHRLRLKASTVRQHFANAYRKLGVTHAAQALVVCFNAGWIDPVQTRVQDPLRFANDDKLAPAQRVYLDAFDEHLRAGDDPVALEAAKRKTDAALVALDQPWRSVASRDWMDGLISHIARLD